MQKHNSSICSVLIVTGLCFVLGTPLAWSFEQSDQLAAGGFQSNLVAQALNGFVATSFKSSSPPQFSARPSNPEGRVWGGALLITGIAATVAGFAYRDVYYSTKDVYRLESNADGSVEESFFTLYKTTHVNPQTALLTSVGLFLNGSYWMLKGSLDGVDLEEYSPLFSERNMAWSSLLFGTLVIVGANLIPEYADEVRRGYEKVTEPSGRVQYFPIQEEHREYSYRQYSVNMAAGGFYIGFALWKLLLDRDTAEVGPSETHPSASRGEIEKIRWSPLLIPDGLAFRISF